MTVQGPDFIVIGAMKCGTSTLQDQLAAQQGVFMSTPKEPNYFSDDDVYARGQGWYEGLFASARTGARRGEASTHYTKLPTYPHTLERMQTLLPDLKLVYMIRNPLVRAVSHYVHEWTERRAGADAESAFRSNETFVDYGRYGMQITPFLEAYGQHNILLTSLEGLVADPDTEFSRIAAFLDLPAQTGWQHDLQPQNTSKERMRRLPFQSLLIEHPVARRLRHILVPAGVREKIKAKRKMTTRPTIPADLEARMIQRFLEDREVLATAFPKHPALDLCYPFRPQ